MPNSIKDIQSLLQTGRFKSALPIINQLLEQSNEEGEEKHELLYLKAVTQRYLNNLDLAFEALRELLQESPNNGRAYQEQAYCYLASNNTEQALVSFHKAVECNPALIASWQKIVELFRIKQHPNYLSASEQLNLLKALPRPVLGAMDLMYEGKLYKAEQVCRQFLQKNKHQVDAMCLLADIGLKLKVFDDAEFLLESCISLYPENEQAKAQYINLLNRLGKFTLASEQAEEFLEIFSSQQAVKITIEATLANCYVNLGQLERGIENTK